MKADIFRRDIVRPGLRVVEDVCGIAMTSEAEVLLIAIAIQESALEHRYQVTTAGKARPGPARGWWQFEQAGVSGVMQHPRAAKHVVRLCDVYHVEPLTSSIWRAIEGHDGLAVALARLLLWSDAAPLPQTEDEAWCYYQRNWRPGKPNRARWPASVQNALAAVYHPIAQA